MLTLNRQKKKRKYLNCTEFPLKNTATCQPQDRPSQLHCRHSQDHALSFVQFYIILFCLYSPHLTSAPMSFTTVTDLITRRFFMKHSAFLHELHFCLSDHIYTFPKQATHLGMLIICMSILIFLMLPCIFSVKGFLTDYYHMPQITLSFEVCSCSLKQ